jgi:hypothetical protein
LYACNKDLDKIQDSEFRIRHKTTDFYQQNFTKNKFRQKKTTTIAYFVPEYQKDHIAMNAQLKFWPPNENIQSLIKADVGVGKSQK